MAPCSPWFGASPSLCHQLEAPAEGAPAAAVAWRSWAPWPSEFIEPKGWEGAWHAGPLVDRPTATWLTFLPGAGPIVPQAEEVGRARIRALDAIGVEGQMPELDSGATRPGDIPDRSTVKKEASDTPIPGSGSASH